jgi:hypothetical protein
LIFFLTFFLGLEAWLLFESDASDSGELDPAALRVAVPFCALVGPHGYLNTPGTATQKKHTNPDPLQARVDTPRR